MLIIWNAISGQLLRKFALRVSGQIPLSYSSDGNSILVVLIDFSIKILNAETGEI